MKMTALIMVLSGLQSWATEHRHTYWKTGRFPSKSGVIGILMAAEGRDQDAPVDDLVALEMAVRVDVPPVVLVDDQAIQNSLVASSARIKPVDISRREYLADATYVVGLGGEANLIARLHQALARPMYALCLGRKKYVPSRPLWHPQGFVRKSLRDALLEFPYQGTGIPPAETQVVWEDPAGSQTINDVPVNLPDRIFVERRIRVERIQWQN
jgi:CRISPR system Cascade subunit CasD